MIMWVELHGVRHEHVVVIWHKTTLYFGPAHYRVKRKCHKQTVSAVGTPISSRMLRLKYIRGLKT